MAVEYNAMYEAERQNISVSHDDFAREIDIDYHSEKELLKKWLLSNKSWEEALTYSKAHKRNEVDSRVANEIFGQTYEKFKKNIESIYIFSEITDFYDFCPTEYYQRLVYKYRGILINSLSNRIGEVDIYKEQPVDNKMQKSFMSLFKK